MIQLNENKLKLLAEKYKVKIQDNLSFVVSGLAVNVKKCIEELKEIINNSKYQIVEYTLEDENIKKCFNKNQSQLSK